MKINVPTIPGRRSSSSFTNQYAAACVALTELTSVRGRGITNTEEAREVIDFAYPKATPLTEGVIGSPPEEYRTFPLPSGDVSLDPYQVDVVAKSFAQGMVYDLGCGIGKTVTAMSASVTSIRKGVAAPIITVVAPLNALGAWEPYRHLIEDIGITLHIVSMDSLHKIQGLNNVGGVIIFDEVHLLGSITARRTKYAHGQRQRASVGFALTGTLMHGGLEKLWNAIELSTPGRSGFANPMDMAEHFNAVSHMHINGRKVKKIIHPPDSATEAIGEYTSTHGVIALTKESSGVKEYTGIPDQEVCDVSVGGTRSSDMSEDLQRVAVNLIRELPPGEPMPHMAAIMHTTAREGLDVKLHWLKGFVQSPTVEKVVVFTAYRDSFARVKDTLDDLEIPYAAVDGSVTGAERVEEVRKFNEDTEVQVFVGQMDAACTSISLVSASISIALEHSWRPYNYDQALARTNRRGQVCDCTHYDVTANTFQEYIVNRLRKAKSWDSSMAEYQDAALHIKQAIEEDICQSICLSEPLK